MSSLKPLLTRQWALGALLVAAATATCIVLGLWQYHRFEARSFEAATIRSNYDAPPVPFADVRPRLAEGLQPSDEYTTVEVSGQYTPESACALYVRNRTLNSAVGFWQLVPFETEQGEWLMVVRGWVDSDATKSQPANDVPYPEESITLTGRLRPAEARLAERGSIPGQLQSVNAKDVQAQCPAATVMGQVYLEASGETAASGSDTPVLPTPLERPSTSLGPHLSYAFQWWIFSLFFPLGFVVSARRRLKEDAAATPAAGSTTGLTTRERTDTSEGGAHDSRLASRYGGKASARSRRSRSTDEDEEDSYL